MREKIFKHRWKIMGIWIIIFTTIVFYLVNSNQRRIVDINRSRVRSCEVTYGSFLDIFRPFFPTDRHEWTKQEKHNWNKLQAEVKRHRAQCVTQTKVSPR